MYASQEFRGSTVIEDTSGGILRGNGIPVR
jgi:hypothetical protein